MNILVLTTPDIVTSALADTLVDGANVAQLAPGSLEINRFESAIHEWVYEVDQALLETARIRWYQALPEDFDGMAHYPVQRCVEKLKGLLDTEQSWVIQDAMLCRFFPIWLPLLKSPQPVLLYSDPLECAVTLQSRWRFPLSFGLALWESFMLSAATAIHESSPMLVSATRLRQDRHGVMASLRELIGRQPGSSVDESEGESDVPPDTTGLSQFLCPAQQRILDALQQGDLSAVAGQSLAAESEDILIHYGRLRAGFEAVKAERDHYRELVRHGVGQEAEILSEPAQDSTSLVTLHIDGREPLEFLAPADAPVVSMLQQCLFRSPDAGDELVYLDLGGETGETLYFMSSSLKYLEISASGGA